MKKHTKNLFIVASFIIASIISTSTGTATATVLTCVPILYPAGVILGAHPALLLGAIYSGARFGDNIAPISDTTIASVATQGAEIGDAVRSRLKYAFAAAGLSIILYVIFGSILGDAATPAQQEAMKTAGDYSGPEALPVLLAPVITIYLCLRKRPLIQAIWFGILGGVAMGLLTGTLKVSDLYDISSQDQIGGALTTGIMKMSDLVFFTFFIMAVLGALKKAGILSILSAKIINLGTTVRKAELAIFSLISLLWPLCAMNTPAILLGGPLVKEIGEKFKIHPSRRANLIDIAGNGITGIFPHINTMLALAAAMIASSTAIGIPLVPLMSVGLFAFHSMMLTAIGLLAIATGWGFKASESEK